LNVGNAVGTSIEARTALDSRTSAMPWRIKQFDGPLSQSNQTRNAASWQMLLQKSVAPNGYSSVGRLRATGFDLPVLTLSAQLSRYATH
jgi:hypothetical protein